MYSCGYKHYYMVMILNIKVVSHHQDVGKVIYHLKIQYIYNTGECQ